MIALVIIAAQMITATTRTSHGKRLAVSAINAIARVGPSVSESQGRVALMASQYSPRGVPPSGRVTGGGG